MHAILFVCLGNICRSPAAEAIFKKKAKVALNNAEIELDSKAVAHWSLGYPPFPKMVLACEKRGYAVDTSKISMLITEEDFKKYDYILAADRSVIERLKGLAPDGYKEKIKLMTAYSSKFHDQDIPDPYYKDEAAFDHAIAMIEDSVEGLLKHLMKA
jgi:protein-tyrosine phosphatase